MNSNAPKAREKTWIASYPRSGNTLLRIFLNTCFNCKSASIYPNDLGNNPKLEHHAGHVQEAMLPTDQPAFIKTHRFPTNKKKAIYVIRDGRDVCMSILQFYKGRYPMNSIIRGKTPFGKWSAHVSAWNMPRRLGKKRNKKPNTLLIYYEDMLEEPTKVIDQLSEWLQINPIAYEIPSREELADGHWIKAEPSQKMSTADEELFMSICGQTMGAFGYQ